jgi:hypothetical protein
MVTSGLLMHSPQPLGWLVSKIAFEATCLALDTAHPSDCPFFQNNPE